MAITTDTRQAEAAKQVDDYNPWMSLLSQGPVTSTTMASPLINLLHQVPTAVSEHAPAVVPGAPAPDFELVSTDGRTVTLADFRGKPLVLRFTRAVGSAAGTFFCPMCTAGLEELSTSYDEFERNGVQLAVLMPTTPEQTTAVASSRGITFPMYSDPDWKLYSAFGAGHLIGAPKQAWAILDGEGIVRWVWRLAEDSENNGHVRRASEVLAVAKDLFGGKG